MPRRFAGRLAALRPLAITATALFASGAATAADAAPTLLPGGMVPADKGEERTPPGLQSLQLRMTSGSRPATVNVELVNRGDALVHVLRDGTPFDDVPAGDVLRILPAGKHATLPQGIPYTGPVYGRMPPDTSRYLALLPGESMRAEIDLQALYRVPSDGAYRIGYRGTFHLADPTAMRALALSTSDAGAYTHAHAYAHAHANVDSWRPETDQLELDLAATPPAAQTRARPPAFAGCSAAQRTLVETATLSGEAAANEALQSLRETPVDARTDSPRYTTWFGIHTAPNYDFVTTVFERISTVLADEPIAYNCSPQSCSGESTVAYVQPFLREDVNLCPLFFDDQLDDAFRAGTVVHELSHLLRIGNTDDFSYGSAASAALARNSPIETLANADSYTLFATNDRPFLPMIDDGTAGPAIPEVPDDVDPDDNFLALPAGFTARGTLGADTVQLFRVTGAVGLELTSVSGDADLYVYDDPALDPESLVCSSIEFSNASVLDSCEIVGEGDRFAAVYGFTETSYELAAMAPSTDGATILPGAVELAGGETVGGDVGEREASIYTAIMPGNIVLNTFTGDADLYVFRDLTLSEEALVCRSVLTTALDTCELPGTGRVHIGVLGFAASNRFELTIESPAGDDPTGSPAGPPANSPAGPPAGQGGDGAVVADSGGGGGGGSPGVPTLLLLSGALVGAHRRRRARVEGGRSGDR